MQDGDYQTSTSLSVSVLLNNELNTDTIRFEPDSINEKMQENDEGQNENKIAKYNIRSLYWVLCRRGFLQQKSKSSISR